MIYLERIKHLEGQIQERSGNPNWRFDNGGCYSFALQFIRIFGGNAYVYVGGYKLETVYHAIVEKDGTFYDSTGIIEDPNNWNKEYKDWEPSECDIEGLEHHERNMKYYLDDQERGELTFAIFDAFGDHIFAQYGMERIKE